MGDRYDRDLAKQRRRYGGRVPPAPIFSWGLTAASVAPSTPVEIGHNGGPPIEEPVNNLFVRWRWKKAHNEAWKNPSMAILKFRVARAEAAGVSYREYMLELLDTGRHLQAGDGETKE